MTEVKVFRSQASRNKWKKEGRSCSQASEVQEEEKLVGFTTDLCSTIYIIQSWLQKQSKPKLSRSIQSMFLIKAELAGAWHGAVSVWLMSTALARSHGQTATHSLRNQLFQTICLNLTLTHPVYPCVQLQWTLFYILGIYFFCITSSSLTHKLHISIRTGGGGNPATVLRLIWHNMHD